ncbi:lanthionine synthetase C family protein [Streptomyces vinaceus]|uniref:lanthionine synthetase C family protein n=1 Tax=Streptomyces vinaceus TaxID=1960 RepID=UPI00382C7AE5
MKATPLLSPDTAARALQTVARVAEQLSDPAHVEAVVRAGLNIPPGPAPRPMAPDLGHGPLGAAFLYGELARTDDSKRGLAHQCIAHAAKGLATAPAHGLIGGPAALLAVTQTCAAAGNDYRDLRRKLAQQLASHHIQLLAPDRPGTDTSPGVPWSHYDWITGPSGTTRLLLDSADSPHETGPDVVEALETTLRHLTTLTEPVMVEGRSVPGWWVSARNQAAPALTAEYPQGFFDLGMAHGITGPLSALCSALDYGREVEGQRKAIETIVNWLLGWILHDEAGPYWPARVTLAEETATTRITTAYTRTAWCYGSPGVAAALHHAGTVLDRPDWCRTALTVLNTALSRNEERWELEGPTLCHGYAGFLLILTRIALATGDPGITTGCRRLTDNLLDHTDDQAAFTFRRHARIAPPGEHTENITVLDSPGMLEGAAGIACALLTTARATQHTYTPQPWDRCLGLGP